ncbi:MAG: ornithine carbamoyltransferase [Deltaproteobacteria bacterium]|nr:ornithine carbamoyltransferase [Deltaproteobacteria bacterium]
MARHFLSLLDWQREEIKTILARAAAFKKRVKGKSVPQSLSGKVLGLVFEKSSTRTRVSFEVAMRKLGGHSLYLTQETSQLGRGETYEDTARVLSRYLDGIVLRTFEQTKLERMAKFSSVPVINGLSDLLHPCQVLADLMTMTENKKSLSDSKVAWVGDGNNMANSWIEAAILFGFSLRLACPEGYDPSAFKKGRSLKLTRSPQEACRGADVINTDTWISMGQEGRTTDHGLRTTDLTEKKKLFRPYQVNKDLLKEAKPDAIILHCLPAHRGEEITDEVMDGPRSRVWDQAENRMYVQMALLEKILS